MFGLIRRFKLAYTLYNIFHKKDLIHNEPVFRKLGLNKKYYSPLSSKTFRHLPYQATERLAAQWTKPGDTRLFQRLSDEDRQSILSFSKNGYAVVRNYLSEEQVNKINLEISELLEANKVAFNKKHKIMFAIRHSQLLNELGNDAQLKELLSGLLEGPAVLFQSINFMQGSEQATHSDSIHMTTYPLGGLLGVWIALEDITMENGPLHYYPGSHLLPLLSEQ